MVPDDVPIADWLDRGTSDPEEVAGRYDAWALTYDDDLASWSYQAPATVAEIVLARRPVAASLLDVGCGTGLVGRTLRGRGFTGRLAGQTLGGRVAAPDHAPYYSRRARAPALPAHPSDDGRYANR